MERVAGDFRADVGFDFCFLRGHVEAWGAVHPVYVEQGHSGQVELGADRGQFLGQRRAFEKAKSGAGVEFDVRHQQLATDLRGFLWIKDFFLIRADP